MKNYIFAVTTVLCAVFNTTYAFEEVLITPNTLLGWESVNLRTDAMVEINTNEPLFGDGSLMFATDTITPGQDKADFQYYWQQSLDSIDFPVRTLGNVEALNFMWYRDSIVPQLRIFSLLSDWGFMMMEERL